MIRAERFGNSDLDPVRKGPDLQHCALHFPVLFSSFVHTYTERESIARPTPEIILFVGKYMKSQQKCCEAPYNLAEDKSLQICHFFFSTSYEYTTYTYNLAEDKSLQICHFFLSTSYTTYLQPTVAEDKSLQICHFFFSTSYTTYLQPSRRQVLTNLPFFLLYVIHYLLTT